MRVSPEKLAEQFLSEECVSKEDSTALFLKDTVVCLFDGLIIFRGDLNMAEAIPRLDAIATGLGLPVAIVEENAAHAWNKKKFRAGKHIGPGNWLKNSWNSNEGFDLGLTEKYDNHGYLMVLKKETIIPEAETKVTSSSSSNSVDRSHVAAQRSVSHHQIPFDPDEEYEKMIQEEQYGWQH